MIFNNGLPLTPMQLIQKEIAQRIPAMKHDPKKDNSLINAYLNGDEQAGVELFRSYGDILSYIYRFPHKAQYKKKSKVFVKWIPQDKEDLFQEIAYQFLVLVHEFDSDIQTFEGLIKGKLHLRVYDNFFEHVADQKINEVQYKEGMNDMQETKKNEIRKPSEHLDLYEALSKLSRKQKKVLELSVVKKWSSAEIAKEIGSTPAAVRKMKERGLNKLRKLLGTEKCAS